MTLKQYKKLAKTIAEKITNDLGGNPMRVRNLQFDGGVTVCARDPKKYHDEPTSLKSGNGNTVIEFDTLSNPNNPNYKFCTLKPGSISAYNTSTHVNVDLTDYRFDTTQFKELIETIAQPGWLVIH